MPVYDHTPESARREERLLEAAIGWLGTVQPDNRPHLVPVWFLWRTGSLLLTADPQSRKIAHIRANPAVSFAVDDSNEGHEPVMLQGVARIGALQDANEDVAAYYDKYRRAMQAMEWPEAEARASHSALIRIEQIRFLIF
jgi:PPOX class probable F420-dependent enzyme